MHYPVFEANNPIHVKEETEKPKSHTAEPFFDIDHKKMKPSLTLPSEHSHRESGEKATERIPKLVCSVSILSGKSGDASSDIEKMLSLGL